MASGISIQRLTGSFPTDIIRSPGSIPASAAAEFLIIPPTIGSGNTLEIPVLKTIPHKSKKANKKFIKAPALITSSLERTGLFKNDLSLSSSSSDIPAILLNPPKGIIRNEYTVSPYLRLYNFGPKPIANSSTCMPVNLAVIKCPAS